VSDPSVSEVPDPRSWSREAWVPFAAGLLWLVLGPAQGWTLTILTVIPGALLLGSGLGMLVFPGDRRISHYGALGGVLGVLLAVPVLVVGSLGTGVVLLAAAAASFLASGAHAMRLDPHPEAVPWPEPTLGHAAQVACDEAILGSMGLTAVYPRGDEHRRIREEIALAREQFESAGWLEKPELYHETPPSLERPDVRPRRTRGTDFEHLRFESGYAPREGEPGRERWQGYARNRTAHAWVVRGDPARPWLVCFHGYQMGSPLVDLGAFDPRWLHQRLGMNLLLPVLPLHGPRKMGRRSGDGFLTGDILDTIHAEAQAMWDARRLLSWVRAQSDAPVGVYGLSLGGYNTALLASLDDGLACAIPGIPLADFARAFHRHGGPWQERLAAAHGLTEESMSEALRVVSPLALEPRVPFAHRALFGGVSDRLVPSDQVRDLWRHWGEPRIVWYQGAHLTFPLHREVRELVQDTLRGAGLAAA